MDKFLDEHIFPYTQKYIGRSPKTKEGFPIYSKGEDILNTASHMVGILIGLAMIIVSVLEYHTSMGMMGGIIFGISLIILYSASSIYHGTPVKYVKEKKMFRLWDHCSIFILIAGTCSPFILSLVENRSSNMEWMFYTFIWTLAVTGITLLCVNMKKFKSITTTMYVMMGISLVLRSQSFSEIIGSDGMQLFIAGGVIYLIGFLFYGLGSKKQWMHGVFHLLCLGGSILHCICVCGYVI